MTGKLSPAASTKVLRIYASRDGRKETSDILEVVISNPHNNSEASMKILATDLGKFKSVACLFDTETNQTEYETTPTQVFAIEHLLNSMQPNQVVIETCTISGWVHDLCQGHGYEVVVANPSSEAWQWRNVKRKTDKDDALKLAKLEALGQIVPVYMPTPAMRQYRRLVKYRKVLVGRINQVKNSIRSLLDAQGKQLGSRAKAWTIEGMSVLEEYRSYCQIWCMKKN
jgi:transposase